jgi:hypothetical protein
MITLVLGGKRYSITIEELQQRDAARTAQTGGNGRGEDTNGRGSSRLLEDQYPHSLQAPGDGGAARP